MVPLGMITRQTVYYCLVDGMTHNWHNNSSDFRTINLLMKDKHIYLHHKKSIFLGQQFTQINNMLWTTDEYGDYLYAINTHTYSADEPSIIIPTSISYRGCLASYMHYVFVVGGWDGEMLDLVQIYDTLDAIWITNTPNMNHVRRTLP
eukprot:596348_1